MRRPGLGLGACGVVVSGRGPDQLALEPPPMSTRLSFPKGFIWGCATSAYQIEGATHEDGRGESIWDRFAKTESARIKDGTNGDVACDHYHRWPEDIALMKELGMAAYRFSVAWPRILPTGRASRGAGVNAPGLDFYARLVDGLLEQGITPYLTLYHWDLPQTLQDEGGWAHRATAEAFVEYADVVSRHLGDRVKYWITHNEPWCSGLLSHEKGIHAPGIRDMSVALAACHHILLSHGWAVPVIRRNCREDAEVGITLNLSPVIPASPSREDAEACRYHDGWMNRWFLEPIFRASYPADMVRDYTELGHLTPESLAALVKPDDLRQIAAPTDFLGVNYYNRAVTRSDKIGEADNLPRTIPPPLRSECTDVGWEVYPDGMFQVLMRVTLEYRPSKILITENGAAYSDGPDATGRVPDEKRVRYFRDHLRAAQHAIEAGAPVTGYFAWSLLDNYEWEQGYSQRFGITWVDYPTQRRIPKDSAFFYRKVVAENAVE
jgi:beta-glucosidase